MLGWRLTSKGVILCGSTWAGKLCLLISTLTITKVGTVTIVIISGSNDDNDDDDKNIDDDNNINNTNTWNESIWQFNQSNTQTNS